MSSSLEAQDEVLAQQQRQNSNTDGQTVLVVGSIVALGFFNMVHGIITCKAAGEPVRMRSTEVVHPPPLLVLFLIHMDGIEDLQIPTLVKYTNH